MARKIEHGILGPDLDSFADLISFGVAPAIVAIVLIYSASPPHGVYTIHLVSAFAAAYLVSGMLRLSRYNVTSRPERFDGVPITAGGLILAIFGMVSPFLHLNFGLIFVIFGVLSILMVSRISYPKIKSPKISAFTGLLILFIVVLYYLAIGLYIYIAVVLFVLLILYLLSPLIVKEGSL